MNPAFIYILYALICVICLVVAYTARWGVIAFTWICLAIGFALLIVPRVGLTEMISAEVIKFTSGIFFMLAGLIMLSGMKQISPHQPKRKSMYAKIIKS